MVVIAILLGLACTGVIGAGQFQNSLWLWAAFAVACSECLGGTLRA